MKGKDKWQEEFIFKDGNKLEENGTSGLVNHLYVQTVMLMERVRTDPS